MAIAPEGKQNVDTVMESVPKEDKNVGYGDSSDCSTSSASRSDSSPLPTHHRRRRRRPRGRGGAKKAKNTKLNSEAELSDEEQALYVAMDCEMVGVGEGGNRSILARVTIVDWQGEILLDQFVTPTEHVTDYRTFVSGISEQHLINAEDIHSCRANVLNVLDGKILVGHHLKNDLKAIGITHPWFMTRDTAKWEPFMKVRFNDGILWPRKLKELSSEKLKRDIQVNGQPHNPVEDAVAALDLYKLVRTKWEKAMVYKMNKTKEIIGQQCKQPQELQ